MSFFSGYDEGGAGDNTSAGISTFANSIFMIVVGLGMFFLSLFSILPNDLFTTALYFDGLGLQPVFGESAKWFESVASLPAVTKEAASFSLALLVLQLYAGYRYAFAGSEGSIVDRIRRGDFSFMTSHKIKWFLFYWMAALFDTMTDAQYRSYFGETGILTASVVSFVFYNLGSEFFIVVGSRTAFIYIMELVSGNNGSGNRRGKPSPQLTKNRNRSNKGRPKGKPKRDHHDIQNVRLPTPRGSFSDL